jgi:N6-adenosine-specific RNA methylase IME4
MEKRISDIIIGERCRKAMGDIVGLANSIDSIGLLHPVVIDASDHLIAGERRIRAFQMLGRKSIPASVVDIPAIVRGELHENSIREDFRFKEVYSIYLAAAPAEIEAALARKAQGRKISLRQISSSFDGKRAPQTRDKVAKFCGVSGRTLEKIIAVMEAAEAEPDNELFAKLVEDMDRTRNANGPFKRLQVARKSAEIRREIPPLPMNGPYRVMSIDPPWPYEVRQEDPTHRATHPYPTMSIEQICKLDVASIAHEDCIIFLWTTNHHMRHAYAVLDAWGFVDKTILTWGKDRFGTGDWLRGQTEHAIMAVRGKPIVQLTNESTLLLGPMRKESQKPEEFYALVEKLCPAPLFAELFSRSPRPNWDGHGDEVRKEAIAA